MTGDWLCQHCGDLNPAFFAYALECGKPARSLIDEEGSCKPWQEWMDGMWKETFARLEAPESQKQALWWEHLDTLAARIAPGQMQLNLGDRP